MNRSLTALCAALFASAAGAQSFPARTGETGILDVPDAEVTQLRGELGAELRFDRAAGAADDFGPLPVYAVAGLAPVVDLGFTMRESGQPGDPRPSRFLFGAALKLQLWAPEAGRPGLALSAIVDRANGRGVVGARFATSTEKGIYRFAAFAGAEGEDAGSIGITAGGAATLALTKRLELAAEALTGPRGENFGGAIRYSLSRKLGVALGGNWFPGDDAFRVAVTLALSPPTKVSPAKDAPIQTPERFTPTVAGAPQFLDDRPKFRLRMRIADPANLGAPGRLQHGPFTPSIAVAAAEKPVATAVRAAAPSLEDLAEAQIREQEALAEARERRVGATVEQLEVRENAARDEGTKLAQRESDLVSREQQLDARDRRIAVRAPATQQVRQLESAEAQLASQERNLAAQERSYAPSLDTAQGREREAAAREDAERQEASRLAASVGGGATRALQIELRKQALGARNRQLAASEARLVARGERLDALERQLRTKTERLDAWQRRLDTRGERLDLLEHRPAEQRPAPTAPKPAETTTAPAKDKAVFVMVVKSPTAIVKEQVGAAATPSTGAAVHTGAAVEKAVAAAGVVIFPNPASLLGELDRETIDGIAKLAARENCELLIWARAKDPSLMGEAQRRAAEIRTRVIASGPLDAQRVVTRITTRPGAQGVDVVVSALRETTKRADTAAAPQAPALLAGESGKRQIREAVQAAQSSIEACVGEVIVARNLQRAEGVLKLTISTEGKVTRVVTGEGDLSGERMEQCLRDASSAWRFPPTEADYVVDVPITVIRGGSAP